MSRGSRSRSTVEHEAALDTSFDPLELSAASEWRELSDGGYSEVYKAHLLGAVVAVKQATSRKKTSGEALLREIRYLRQIGPHPNVVQPYGAFVEHGKLHLVLHFTRHCLRSDRVARQCDPIKVIAGVARALVRIHSFGIVHRDLKARNVLVEADDTSILIDFGLACDLRLDDREWIGRTVGTKKYRPPEMRDGRPAQPALDVYSLGLMCSKLVRQRRDAHSSDESSLSEDGREERRDMRLLLELSEDCTKSVPSGRPTAWALLSRLQRHMGEEVTRCDAPRSLVPLGRSPSALADAARGEIAGRRKRRRNSDGDRSRCSRNGSRDKRGREESGSREEIREKRARSSPEAKQRS
ncbi:hypothetical protein AB1Y20_020404 [Prymnesium parvum]|uniref:Protein kinase domain-containing protein n=1 Tax=Prymnesium parvum TaxID=97485 RepID=A0AB34JZ75_PRYPA